MILAGDIGGTHARLALFERDRLDTAPAAVEIFLSHEHSGLEEIVRTFLDGHQARVDSACFGIAGPVRGGRSAATNIPWVADAHNLAAQLGSPVRLINDLEANAYGIELLKPQDFVALNVGVPDPAGNQGLISAGTGLGCSGLVPGPSGYVPFPTEGGHADFAPRNEIEIELLRYLLGRFGHVGVERVLSGPGLVNIYSFLRDTGRGAEPPWLTEQMAHGDPAATISRNGLEHSSEICVQALDLFLSIYGSEAGNLALRVLATGGVFIGGGIAPAVSRKFLEPAFLKAFVSKDRMEAMLAEIPVRLIMNDKAALLGAARVARMVIRNQAALG
jgi:glucokinase